jgi:hypothetical protein
MRNSLKEVRMKKKIVGILVCTLLITTVTLPIVSADPQIDQSQEKHDAEVYIPDFHWQEFVPEKVILNSVEVKVAQLFEDSPDLELTIERPLGNVLRWKEVPASEIPSFFSDWIMFDIPDIELTLGGTYVIRLTAPAGSEYTWGAGNGDPYPKEISTMHPDDFCFRTWASTKSRDTNEIVRDRQFPLIYWFLYQNPSLFPILRLLLQRLGLQ